MRYPIEPLQEVTGWSSDRLRREGSVSGQTWKKYQAEGMPEPIADRLAVKCGLVPFLVWPNWLEDVGKPCEECGAWFVPFRRNGRFCGKQCQQRKAARVRYNSNPEYRARQLEQRRRYYEECKSYVNRKNSQYYWENRDEILARQAEYDAATYDPEKRRARYQANRDQELKRQREYDRRKRAESQVA